MAPTLVTSSITSCKNDRLSFLLHTLVRKNGNHFILFGIRYTLYSIVYTLYIMRYSYSYNYYVQQYKRFFKIILIEILSQTKNRRNLFADMYQMKVVLQLLMVAMVSAAIQFVLKNMTKVL